MIPADALARFRLAAMIVYAGAMAVIHVKAGQPERLWWFAAAIPFYLWTVAPILVPLFLRRGGWVLVSGVSAIAVYSLVIYWRAMFGPDPSSTSALVFIFLPLYQWCGVALVAGLAFIVRRLRPQ